ncbi:MAG: ECF transporter S component, partial [Anaerococcus hydrogenalis]|nr:ECF transporter S component [Anaerococcus hydrogenalis]
LIMTLAATLSNAFVIFPLYGKAMGVDMNAFVAIAHKTNTLVKSYFTMMIFAIVPFNLIKGFIEILVTKLLYKHVSSILHDRR